MKLKYIFLSLVTVGIILSSCGGDAKSENKDEKTEKEGESDNVESSGDSAANIETVYNGDLKMAYINSDSIITGYKGFIKVNQELRDKRYELEQEIMGAEKSLIARGKKLQKTYEGGVYIERELMADQEKLQRDQQFYQEKFAKATQEQSDMEQRASMRQLERINDFIIRYGDKNSIDFILQKPGGIVYGKQSFNITESVLEELNAEYDAGEVEEESLDAIIEADSLSK